MARPSTQLIEALGTVYLALEREYAEVESHIRNGHAHWY